MKSRSAVYLCVCIDHFYIQARLRVHPEHWNVPVAIVDGEPGLTTIVDLNRLASVQGMSIGMSRVQASLDPALLIFSRSPDDEARTKEEFTQACRNITPLIEDSSAGNACILVLDIQASLKLFGNMTQLAAQLTSSLVALNLQVRLAVSSNFHTCILLAKTPLDTPFIYVPQGQESSFLSGLPLSCLPLTLDQQDTFANWGIHRLEDLAALPLTELISRMGQSAKYIHELAHGIHPHVFRPMAVSAPLKELVSFDVAVDLYESLLFSLAPMLDKLITRAQEEMKSISILTLAMGLSNRSTHIRVIQPAIPSTSSKLLLKLIHLDMESHPPAAGVIDLTLTAALDNRPKAQLGIFSPQHPDASQLHVTLARISKLVGAEHVGSPVLEDCHRQSLFVLKSFSIREASRPDAFGKNGMVAMRRVHESIRIPVTTHHEVPTKFLLDGCTYQVEHAYGPWISSGQWWNETPWNISQWDVIASGVKTERPLHCCLSMDRMSSTWALDGIYD